MLGCKGAEGDDCSSDTECHSNLTCQPIRGRPHDYCCPTPATASKEDNCHAIYPSIGQ
jgi:hypothetical protein